MELISFKKLIEKTCGLTFEESRETALISGIKTRLAATGISDENRYFSRILADKEEFHRLIDLLTINETYFFREPSYINLFAEKVLPSFLQKQPVGKKIHVLSAGCSTGEEPYSLAMALSEKFGPGFKKIVSIHGADIDHGALNHARVGRYRRHSFRNISETLKGRYFFSEEAGLFGITDEIKGSVFFHQFNLLQDAVPAGIPPLHVIFYRNVSIYFSPEIQQAIFSKLAESLIPGGYLFVGAGETLSHNSGVLPLVEMEGIFVFHKSSSENLKEDSQSPKSAASASRPLTLRAVANHHTTHGFKPSRQYKTPTNSTDGVASEGRFEGIPEEILSLLRDEKYSTARQKVDEMLRLAPDNHVLTLYKAGILVNLGEFDETDRLCRILLKAAPLCLEAYLLLGLSSKARGDEIFALKCFKDALYVQSSCWFARFQLAEIHRNRGKARQAKDEYQAVIDLLDHEPDADSQLAKFPLLFHPAQIRQICALQILRIGKGV
ncbi:MAG: hypothetical protein HQM09_09535 [Candidatus Riflebacteria bacterium]|nr:hypothetical protein [Candidatus Riflebacteria bacterium]